MSQNVTVQGATYSDVPGIELPKQGGGTAYFADTSDANATAADIDSGKTAYVNGIKITGTGSGGGGGGSNIVRGTFTTGATRDTKEEVTLSYSGNGYPVSCMVYIDGGPYNSGTGGNATWYNSVNRYDTGWVSLVKCRYYDTPTYTGVGENNASVLALYKNSTTSATTYTNDRGLTNAVYTASGAGSGTFCIAFKSNTKMSYYIGNMTNTTKGLAPSTKYTYVVEYSE